MLQNSSEFNSVGPGFGAGGFGGFGGGMGTFGLFGLLGIDSLTGRRRGGEGDCDGGPGRNELATLAAITNAKDTTVAEGRALGAAICDAEKTNLQQFYAAAIQAANNTQAIKDQATAFAIVADKRFDDLASAGVLQTASIIARINQTEIDALRDQLHGERRRGDAREVEINITNSANATAQQLQAQFQVQSQRDNDIHRRLDYFSGQINKASNDVINFGTMAASANQANQQTNIK